MKLLRRITSSSERKSYIYEGYRIYNTGSGWVVYKGNKAISSEFNTSEEAEEFVKTKMHGIHSSSMNSKSCIQSGQDAPGFGYGEKYRYWDDPELADRVTDTELDDSIKADIFNDALEDMKYDPRFRDDDRDSMWDYFVSRVTIWLQDILEYEYPEASWATWYEDAKRRFDEWWPEDTP